MNNDRIQILEDITPDLLQWYARVRRTFPWREGADAYRIWISEIMLQQTRIEAVLPYYERFLTAFPDVSALALAPEEKVLKLWEGLGYYSRARNLQKAALLCVEKHGGKLPDSYEALRALPGIGNYTAGAIGSIAFGLPVPAVDGNVLRVLSRLFADSREMDGQKIRTEMERLLTEVIPRETPGDFNEALMELGETVCIPNGSPRCEQCPLARACLARSQKNPEAYPVRAPKKARKVEMRTVLLLEVGDRVAIRQRPDSGLLAGLYEFPCLEGLWKAEELTNWIQQYQACELEDWKKSASVKEEDVSGQYSLLEIDSLGSAKHIFSHVEWHMVGFRIRLEEELAGDWIYVPREELEKTYPLPTAYQTYRKQV